MQVASHHSGAGCRSLGIKPLEITGLGSSRSLLGTPVLWPQLSSCNTTAVGCYANGCAGAATLSPSAQSIHLLGFLFCFNGQIRPVLSQSASSLCTGYEHSISRLGPHSTGASWTQPHLGHDLFVFFSDSLSFCNQSLSLSITALQGAFGFHWGWFLFLHIVSL